MIEAADEMRNAIAAVRYKLPLEMREPVLRAHRSGRAARSWSSALSSTTQSHAEISRLAEDVLADRFRGIDGVAIVNVNGSLQRELSVLLRAEKLREYNVSVGRRGQRAAQPEHQRAGGQRAGRARRAEHPPGRAASSRRREFKQIVVKRSGDEIVRLGQVADDRGRLRRPRQLQPAQRQPERRHLDHALARRLDRLEQYVAMSLRFVSVTCS